MKLFMYKLLISALVASAAMVNSSALAAAPVFNVVESKHNLSSGGTGEEKATLASGAVSVCIFCHTPHNALKAGPLWNKAMLTSPTVYNMYTSSSTLSNATKASSLPANSPSLLCLGCHDGKTAMNILHNTSYGAPYVDANYPAGVKIVSTSAGVNVPNVMPAPLPDMFGDPTSADLRIGRGDSLGDDHPVGFSYKDAYNETIAKNSLNDYVGMDPAVRFFGPEKRVECSSCHNPHISGTDAEHQPFLVKSNAKSALCLTCHNK